MAEAASHTALPTQSVKIIYIAREDLTEAVYIAGSFTQEPWLPVKMDTKSSHRGEDGTVTAVEFMQEFHLRPGPYQYKFRIGEGDRWVCDERHEIVKDELGNSNNLLIVHPQDKEDDLDSGSPGAPSPQVLPESEIGKAGTEELPVLPGSALGTWHPDEELSPMHRRASTNLGVRISRMGTFLPPADDEDEEEHLVVHPLDVPPVDLETRLHEIEQEEEADSDDMSSAEDELEVTKKLSEGVKNVTTTLTTKIKDHEPSVSSLDRIAESSPESFQPFSVEDLTRIVHLKSSGKTDSYGTIEASSPTKANAPSTCASITSSTESQTPLLKGRQTNHLDSGDNTQDQKSENSDKPAPRGLVIFVLLAAWFRGLWQRLCSMRPGKHDDTDDIAK